MKVYSKCEEEKELEDFNIDNRSKDCCNKMLGSSMDRPNTLIRGATYLLSRGYYG